MQLAGACVGCVAREPVTQRFNASVNNFFRSVEIRLASRKTYHLCSSSSSKCIHCLV
jgi:hypothetical protein